MNSLNLNGANFAAALGAAKLARKAREETRESAKKLHVIGAGRTISSAYEQLRNAAEYTEEHLLLSRAIRRFYKRVFITDNQADIQSSGGELITELTLAGYIPGDSVPIAEVDDLSRLASEYYSAYIQLHSATSDRADRWVIDVLAVEVEARLLDRSLQAVFVQFAFDHFLGLIDQDRFFKGKTPPEFELSLYIAVHRALLKSDDATIRRALIFRFGQSPAELNGFRQVNEKIDSLIVSSLTDKLSRLVSREGAALRVLWRLLNDHEDVSDLLTKPSKFLPAYEAQILTEYDQTNQRINSGIIKSVAFLIITKFLIGIGIEVPYDLIVHGEILWLPLVINLLLPPVYMVLLRLTLTMPGPANTAALIDQIDYMLYKTDSKRQLVGAGAKQQFGVAFNVAFGLLFIVIFGLVSWGLVSLGFSLVHLLIFFVFFSAASFLGFRLSRTIRELEAVESEQTGLAMLRDLIYLPFVVVGQKISEGYSKFNIVTLILDMLIELPLKTVLRLVRQWGSFITAKKDEL